MIPSRSLPLISWEVIKTACSRFELVEFMNADATANTINTWASTSTNNLIPTITQREEILPNMKMIFVNIIYFKGLERGVSVISSDPSCKDSNTFFYIGNLKNVVWIRYPIFSFFKLFLFSFYAFFAYRKQWKILQK